jgi:hypothetical protein
MHATTISMCQSDLKDKILEAAESDQKYKELKEKLQQGNLEHKVEDYKLEGDEIIRYKGRIYVPNYRELKNLILVEMHNVPYAGHPGYHKSIAAVKSQYYCPVMKKEVYEFITKCLACQKVKEEHKHLAGLLQPLPIPEWKWEVVIMDFITKLPRTNRKNDFIMVVVDKLTKAAHFIPVKLTHKASNIADIYLKEITRLHGMPKTTVSDRDPKFT